jgi:uncharacterized membrane protein
VTTESGGSFTGSSVQDRTLLPSRAAAFALLLSGLLGTLAAAVLVVEKFLLLANPFYVPSCTVNATVNCGAVMSSPQAEVFGFPNPVIGLAAFPVVAAVGAAVLAGARMRTWFWAALAGGSLLGWAFVHWLIFQSVFVIGALCPYCMLVWACVPVAAMAAISVLAPTGRLLRSMGRNAVLIGIAWTGGVVILVTGALANIWGA